MLTLIGGALLALTGYSAGVVATARRRGTPLPGVIDAVGAIVAATTALVIYGHSRWVLAAGTAIGLVWGLLLGGVLARRRRVLGAEPRLGGRMASAKAFSRSMGQFQGRVLLLLFYLVVVPPFAFIAKRSSKHAAAGPSHWVPMRERPTTVEEARQQH